jgi:diguanylate cyclase (GGDEF)-like protein
VVGLWSRLALAVKIFVVCAVLALVASSVGNILFYRMASRCLRDEARQRLQTLASTVACQIDPNLHSTIRGKQDENSPAYRRIKAVLRRAGLANPDLRDLYTIRPTTAPMIWRFVVDSEQDPKLISHLGDTYDARQKPEIGAALLGPSADREPYTDRRGTWLSGYAPIRDESGRTEAVVGLDMSAERVLRAEAALKRAEVVDVVVCTALAVGLGLLVTQSAVKLCRMFSQAAERVRTGDLDFELDLHRADEVGEFADTFNQMLVGLRESRKRMADAADTDPLTGLSNHVHFHERLDDEMQRATLQGGQVCVLLIDVDRFTLVNEAFGHDVGDGLVQQVADVLSRNVRKTDIVARYGGDDFAVILPDTDVAEGQEMAERLRAKVEEHAFRNVPVNVMPIDTRAETVGSLNLTVTVGMAAYPAHHSTKDGLVMAADIALCQAQRAARNTVCVFDPGATINEGIDPYDLYQALRDPSSAAMQSLAAAVDARDPYTQGHSERVARYAVAVAEAVADDPQLRDNVWIAGLVHDLGKLGIPDAILSKPAGLTEEEHAIIRGHPSLGESILRRAHQLEQVIPGVLHHHERWDGAGYPDGLAGEQIPFIARILGVADAFDAMTTDRPYRSALTLDEATSELRAGVGKQFDPSLVEPFIQSMQQEWAKRAA